MRALDMAEGFSNGFKKAAFALYGGLFLIVVGDEVAECLGVGLRGEAIAFPGEELLHPEIIFDHSVVHERDLPIAAAMGVCVCFGHLAVGGPTGVADAEIPSQLGLVQGSLQFLYPARALDLLKAAGQADHQTGRVIAAVFQALQALQHDASRTLTANVSNYSAHMV